MDRMAGDSGKRVPRSPGRLLLMAGMAVFVLTGVSGCIAQWMYGGIPNRVEMEPRVHALAGLNTGYDEFNAVAAPPPLHMDALVVFAGNAGSQGERFAIEAGRLRLTQNPYSQSRDKRPPPPRIESGRTGSFPLIPPAPGNLRGPTALVSPHIAERGYEHPPASHHMTLGLTQDKAPLPWVGNGVLGDGGVWMFDSDHEGRRNLYFVAPDGRPRPFFGNLPGADEAYAAYDFQRHELYFSSNRSGRFQLYRYRNHSRNTDFARWLDNPALAARIEPAAEFHAEADTLAPFVEGNLLVFASNRPGGFGGFDLYASEHRDGAWSRPRNLQDLLPAGVEVNSASNEFRPSLLTMRLKHYHELRLLLFSSDRPGGQGGYDLYVTALPRGREW